MAENKYIYNKHKAPIIVHTRDDKGKIVETITFQPERMDVVSGRVVSTGYTALTEMMYKKLCETSKTFNHYKDKLKLLTVQDDLPPEAKTPHEALVDSRRKEREALTKVTEQEAEITSLKARLLDAEGKYKTLQSASTNDEKLKPLNDQIKELMAKYDNLAAFTESFIRSLERAETKDKAVQQLVESFKKSYVNLPAKAAGS
jgi:chromosome segregation ATPase